MDLGPDRPLYERLLGAAAERLPAVIRRMHRAVPRVVATGAGTVTRGNLVARALAGLLGFPAAGLDRPLRVTFEAKPDGEHLSRRYPDATLTTLQTAAGPDGSGLLNEQLGPFALTLRLHASETSLDFELIDMLWHGLRLPRFAWPRLLARETADGDIYCFHVRIDLPLIGRLIEYRGRLTIGAPEPEPAEPLILFDGICNLCSWSVAFLVPRDRSGRLRFAPIQSDLGRRLLEREGLPLDAWESFLFLDDGRAYQKSDAWFRIVALMHQPWPLLRLFRFLPRRLTDWAYDRVARNRYAIFGRRETCLVPTPELKARFLG